ncbi:MAG: glycosyltransferase family 4 protein [Candidatus Methanomethyliaceae archaeon]
MNICFFTSSSLTEGGGVENWIINVSQNMIKHHRINILGLRYAENKILCFKEISLSLNKISYQELPFVKLPKGAPLPNPLYLNHLLNLFDSNDLVYIILPNSPIEGVLYLLRKYLKCKLIAGFHNSLSFNKLLSKVYMPAFKKFLDVFDTYHVINRETYTYLKKMGLNNVFFIPNGVNTNVFQLCDNPFTSSFFNVIFTGRLSEEKGVYILIEIIRYVNEILKISDMNFIITGAGPLENKIRAIARRYNNVNYLGFVDTKDMPKIYRSANLLLMPSKIEGMPLRLLEAQSCGLPVIGSRIPGILDVVLNGKTGHLVEVGDIKGFSETIKNYYELWRSSPKRYYEMNQAIREHVVRNYDWSIIINKLEEMFLNCLTA